MKYRIVASDEAPVWRVIEGYTQTEETFEDEGGSASTCTAVVDLPDDVAMPLLREPGFYDTMEAV